MGQLAKGGGRRELPAVTIKKPVKPKPKLIRSPLDRMLKTYKVR